MDQDKYFHEQLDELRRRVDKLEEQQGGSGTQRGTVRPTGGVRAYCSVPQVPEKVFGPEVSAERARLINVMSKKWVNGTVLHYYFFDNELWGGNTANKDIVRRAFQLWKDVGIGLEFREVSSAAEAEIRIGFLRGDGSWSYIGRDILNVGQNERTMNFGWDLTQDAEEIDTAIHEIGHTLGYPHEHQNPHAGIVWDEDVVYETLAGAPNFWSRETTEWNVIRKISPDTVEGTNWDPNSVMHYPFSPGLIKEPAQYRNGLYPQPGLSQKDISQSKFFYPRLELVYPELKALESQTLSIGPGGQKNFVLIPAVTRQYRFRTFGESDTVMVLFEDHAGEMRYVTGDDDSGTDLNASFRVRLIKGRKYILRIRLYYNFSSGGTAVMMW